MENKKIFDCSKWFVEQNLTNFKNDYKSNLKLQKLLFFSQLISIVKSNKFLFDDQFHDFEHGMVMDLVRLKYSKNFEEFMEYKISNLSKEDLEILKITQDIYGSETADVLSEMSHEFTYWKKYYYGSLGDNGFKIEEKSLVPNEELKKELKNMKNVLKAYEYYNSNENVENEGLIEY